MKTARKPLPPATGTCQWLSDATNGNRRLEITTAEGFSTIYEVEEGNGVYRLHQVKSESGEFACYTVRHWASGAWECDCPDAKNRPERRCACKHAKALPAALKKLPF